MPRHKYKPEEVAEHERRAWALRQRGWTQERIAEELKLTQRGVGVILARLSKRYLASLGNDVNRHRAQQTTRLEHILDEAMQAWERSRDAEGSDGAVPAFLDQARGALADLRKLWGLDAPKRHELTGADGGPMEIASVDALVSAAAKAQELIHARARTESNGTNGSVEAGPAGPGNRLPS